MKKYVLLIFVGVFTSFAATAAPIDELCSVNNADKVSGRFEYKKAQIAKLLGNLALESVLLAQSSVLRLVPVSDLEAFKVGAKVKAFAVNSTFAKELSLKLNAALSSVDKKNIEKNYPAAVVSLLKDSLYLNFLKNKKRSFLGSVGAFINRMGVESALANPRTFNGSRKVLKEAKSELLSEDELNEDITRRIVELESKNVILRMKGGPEVGRKAVYQLMVNAFEHNITELKKKDPKSAGRLERFLNWKGDAESLRKALDKEITVDSKIMKMSAGWGSFSDYRWIASASYASFFRRLADQAAVVASADPEELIMSDDLALSAYLSLSSGDVNGVEPSDLCVLRAGALKSKRRKDILLLAGSAAALGATVVTFGASAIVAVGAGGSAVATIGTAAGVVATLSGMALTAWDGYRILSGKAARERAVARALFNAQLAGAEFLDEAERRFRWNVFGLVAGGTFAPADAVLMGRMFKMLSSRGLAEGIEAAEAAARTARTLENTADEMLEFLRAQLAACGIR